MEQCLLYVPSDVPEPNAPDFVAQVAPTIEALVNLTAGRAFVLCTSYKNMRALHERLKPRLPYPVLLQGERPRSALLEDFRSRSSVLFATSSFWEGVDVPGEKLSLVIMDKLPFASPPIPSSRRASSTSASRAATPFVTTSCPAAIALKQGFGVRSQQDRCGHRHGAGSSPTDRATDGFFGNTIMGAQDVDLDMVRSGVEEGAVRRRRVGLNTGPHAAEAFFPMADTKSGDALPRTTRHGT
jgi:hypothetical protein